MRSSSHTLSKLRSSVSTYTAAKQDKGGCHVSSSVTGINMRARALPVRRALDEVQDAQLRLGLVAQHDEVERREVAVDELRVLRGWRDVRRAQHTCAHAGRGRANAPGAARRVTRLAERGLVLHEAAQVVGCGARRGASARVSSGAAVFRRCCAARARRLRCGAAAGKAAAPRRVTTLNTVRSSSCCLSTGCGEQAQARAWARARQRRAVRTRRLRARRGRRLRTSCS